MTKRKTVAPKPKEPEHFHLGGRGCCPHPECVRSVSRQMDKGASIMLAEKILKAARVRSSDAKLLAQLTLQLLK